MTVRNSKKAASVSRIGKRRQVVIPKPVCEALGLEEGDFVEVQNISGVILMKPKILVDADNVLTSQEEVLVRRGEAQLRRGEHVTLDQLRHELDHPAVKRRRKTA